MPTYKYKLGGKTYTMSSPTPKTPEQVRAKALAAALANEEKRISSQGSGTTSAESFVRGAMNPVYGAGQIIDEAIGTKIGPNDTDVAFMRGRQDILNKNSPTAEGLNIAGDVLPWMLAPGGQKRAASRLPVLKRMMGLAAPGAAYGVLQPTGRGESRAGNTAKGAAGAVVLGGTLPALGKTATVAGELLPTDAARVRKVNRKMVETFPEGERAAITEALSKRTMLPLSSAATSGNKNLAMMESRSRLETPSVWDAADQNLQQKANEVLDNATISRKQAPVLKRAQSAAVKAKIAELESKADPYKWAKAQNTMLDDLRANMGRVGPTARGKAESLEKNILREDVPTTIEGLANTRAELKGDRLTPIRDVIDTGLESIPGGNWKEFMGKDAELGRMMQETKKATNAGKIYDAFNVTVPGRTTSLPRGARSPAGDIPNLTSTALTNALRRYGTDKYGNAISEGPGLRLSGLTDELAAAETAAKSGADKVPNDTGKLDAMKSLLHWRTRPLARDIINAGGGGFSEAGSKRIAEVLANPDEYAALLKGARISPRRQMIDESVIRALRSGGAYLNTEE